MSFDRVNGELWAADVGQDLWEEVDIIRRGGNYGWNVRESFHPFKGGEWRDEFINPVLEYGRELGNSITGGYVYRGSRMPALYGAYVYGEYTLGTIWAARIKNGKVVDHKTILRQPKNIPSFAEGPDGELYILAFDGRIYQLEESHEPTPDPL